MSTVDTTNSNGDVVRVVPLTTIWTPPAGCPLVVSAALTTTLDSHCEPPNFVSVWQNGGYYSPGVCFSDYTIGCTATGWLNGVSIKDSETAALCVPSGYTCFPRGIAGVTNWAAIGVSEVSTSSTVQYLASDLFGVPAFQIRWAASDLSVLESSPTWSILTTSSGIPIPAKTLSPAATTSTLPPATATSSLSPSATASTLGPTGSAVPTADSSQSRGLSGGAIAGIAVGVAAALALSIVLLFFCVRRRRWRQQDDAAAADDDATAELGANPSTKPLGPAELGYGLVEKDKLAEAPSTPDVPGYDQRYPRTVASELPAGPNAVDGELPAGLNAVDGELPAGLNAVDGELPATPLAHPASELPAGRATTAAAAASLGRVSSEGSSPTELGSSSGEADAADLMRRKAELE